MHMKQSSDHLFCFVGSIWMQFKNIQLVSANFFWKTINFISSKFRSKSLKNLNRNYIRRNSDYIRLMNEIWGRRQKFNLRNGISQNIFLFVSKYHQMYNNFTMLIYQTLIFILCLVPTLTWVRIKDYNAAQSSAQTKAVAFSLKSDKLFTAGKNGTVQVWALPAYTLEHTIDVGEQVNRILIHPQNSDIYVNTVGGSLKAYGTDYVQKYSAKYGGINTAYDIEWTKQDGSQLMAVGDNSGKPTVYVYSSSLANTYNFSIYQFTNGSTIEQIASGPDYSTIFVSTSDPSNNGTHVVKTNGDQQIYDTDQQYDNNIVKLLEFNKNDASKVYIAQFQTNLIQIGDTSSAIKTVTPIILKNNKKVEAINGDLSNYFLIGTSEPAASKNNVLLYQYAQSSIARELSHPSKIRSIAVSPDQYYIVVGLQYGFTLWHRSDDVIEQTSSYAPTLAAVSGVIFVGSVGALAATSAAQGVAGGVNVVGAGVAAGQDVGLTGKNLL